MPADDRRAGAGVLCAEARLFDDAWVCLSQSVRSLTAADFERPSGCSGWRIRDLLYHLVIAAQDILITLATPAAGPTTARLPPTIDDADAVAIVTGRRRPSVAEARIIDDLGLSGVPFSIG